MCPAQRMTVPKFTALKARGPEDHDAHGLRLSRWPRLLDAAGIEGDLVGDSMSMVVQGHDNTLPVTLDEMIYHAEMVGRAVGTRWWSSTCRFRPAISGHYKAIENAGRILKETRCQAVKLEGGAEQADMIAALVSAGIPVMAHCGLRPQSVHQLGGYKVQRDEEQLAGRRRRPPKQAGAFAMVLECIPPALAQAITAARADSHDRHRRRRRLRRPGAGRQRSAGHHQRLRAAVRQSVRRSASGDHRRRHRFRDDVRAGKFPGRQSNRSSRRSTESRDATVAIATSARCVLLAFLMLSVTAQLSSSEISSCPIAWPHETSPYLLQHAAQSGRLVSVGTGGARPGQSGGAGRSFLSIGYSACHWCHVMEHESFENPQIAALLNEHFVSIKVDREERPDLDQIYMNAVQMHDRPRRLADVGLPDARLASRSTAAPIARRPTRDGHAGLRPGAAGRRRRLAEPPRAKSSTQAGRADRASAATAAAGCRQAGELTTASCCDGAAAALDRDRSIRSTAASAARRSFRIRWTCGCCCGIWRRGPATTRCCDMVTHTLDKMAGRRHLRSPRRRLPPLLGRRALAGAALREDALRQRPAGRRAISRPSRRPATRDYARVARETLDYVLREMTDPAGGFYSTEDADSEGEEGKFYVWTPAEIEAVLGAEAAKTFCYVYDVSEAGNFERAATS